MRFHCGISFSWRTIKKFLFPILIGLLGFFGFNFIKENHKELVMQVSALENYYSRFDIDYSTITPYVEKNVDTSGHKLIDIVNNLKSNTSIIRDYTIFVSTNSSNNLAYLHFLAYDNSSNYTFNFYGFNDNTFRSVITWDAYRWGYSIAVSGLSDIFSNSSYLNFVSCISGNSCDTLNSFGGEKILFYSDSTINNNSNNNLSYRNSTFFIFYSTKDLIINNTYLTNNQSMFYKSIYVNGNSVEVGSKFPTYYDLYLAPEPEPEPEPEPDPEINHKPLHDKIYWFDDNTTEIGILSSIYICLFLYCITMLILRILSIVNNKRW